MEAEVVADGLHRLPEGAMDDGVADLVAVRGRVVPRGIFTPGVAALVIVVIARPGRRGAIPAAGSGDSGVSRARRASSRVMAMPSSKFAI
jgi:hypothetical protein